jgi:hypothetical protein
MEPDIINMLKKAIPILKPILGDFSGIPNITNLMAYTPMTRKRTRLVTGMARLKIFFAFSGNRL